MAVNNVQPFLIPVRERPAGAISGDTVLNWTAYLLKDGTIQGTQILEKIIGRFSYSKAMVKIRIVAMLRRGGNGSTPISWACEMAE